MHSFAVTQQLVGRAVAEEWAFFEHLVQYMPNGTPSPGRRCLGAVKDPGLFQRNLYPRLNIKFIFVARLKKK